MARSKKSRKGGENGPKQAPRVKKSERKVIGGKKNDSGRKSGSRHNEALIEKESPHVKTQKNNDPRHGSKKPVALSIAPAKKATVAASAKVKQPKLTDEQKLLKLEEDPRFNDLLDLLEEGKDLAADDQKWLDSQLSKIESLMEKLGISDAEELPAPAAPSKKAASDDDLYERFETGADVLKDYQS
ncbi:GTPase-activating protein [Shewanella sp. 10N.286.52.C2]|uniref:Der GTPase-activating protein YihI n=1 Tax=Shewanella sp. 10N.286.52.C2 TaxID=1880838 RepID=UPI000C8243AB|nr:Der GTPase-activating protein YihI [Shewanella sp. 10N.286.52.C2]PMG30552.1 GTPase-activating protein [Shewanella sp. 10N.286.52.C2]